MMLESRSRGQPLVVLGLVLVAWVGVRAFAWDYALQAARIDRVPVAAAGGATQPDRQAQDNAPQAGAPDMPQGLVPVRPDASLPAPLPSLSAPGIGPRPPLLIRPGTAELPPAAADLLPLPPGPSPAGQGARMLPAGRIAGAAGHHALWLAATALMPLPPLGLREGDGQGLPSRAATGARRWSADAWLLLRGNPYQLPAPGPAVGTYGASQAGAVLRYRLAPNSPLRPAAYVRGAIAIGQSAREHDAAFGISARPLAQVPVAVMAEARVTRSGSAAARVRPSVALVTELPPQRLGGGFTGEIYVQAGWIGGSHPGTFIDGLARAERPVASLGESATIKAGAGAWAATQRGMAQQQPATRVDVGPSASVAFRLAEGASARLEADWRFRVHGSARPGSGPVLTLSAGF